MMNKIELRQNERIDDLLVNNLKIIQNSKKYCFTSDAIELANFVDGGIHDKAVDIGSGSGVIAILLAGKKNIKTTAIEIQPDMAEMASRSIKLNNLESKVSVCNFAIQEANKYFERESFSIVVCNPPYRKNHTGEYSKPCGIRESRHEILVTLDEIVDAAGYLLKNGGRFYIVHMCERMAEVFRAASRNRLEPKVLQIITPDDKKQPHIFMLKCIKNAKAGLIVNKERAVLPFGNEM